MDLDQTLDVLFDHLPRPYVFEDAHIYEILQKISEHKISVVPILTKEEKYVGCTTVHQVVAMIGNTGGIKEHGAILVLEVNQIDYSLAQIAQIVESNNAKILSSYIMSSPDSTKLEVTLKINKTELDPIIRTFERYDYTISASFQKSDFNDDLQLRYDSLINYLKL
jgi:CBS domain-containing protein